MSLDERLRVSLERSSRIADPDVRRNLARARRRGRRLVVARRVAAVAVAVAAVAAAIVAVPRLLSQVDRTVPDVQPHAPTGRFEANLRGDGGPFRQHGLNGRWTLSFLQDGRLQFVAPAGASVRQLRPAYTFEISGNLLTTDLFRHDVCAGAQLGTYRWSAGSGRLRFVVDSDRCAVRRAVLTSAVWSTTTAPSDDPLEGTWWAAGITCEDGVAAEARGGFTARELELGGRGRFTSVRRCLAGGRTSWDETVTFRNGRFVALCGSPTDGHLCVNGTYGFVRPDVVVVNDGWSAPTIRFAIDGDRLTMDVIRLRLVQPGMSRVNRLEDWVAATFGYESKPFTRVS